MLTIITFLWLGVSAAVAAVVLAMMAWDASLDVWRGARYVTDEERLGAAVCAAVFAPSAIGCASLAFGNALAIWMRL